MDETMTTARLLDQMHAKRQTWDELRAQISDERMCQTGAVGDWSVKDLVAHLTWAERETVGMLAVRAFVGSPWWALPLDERNAMVYAANRQRPLDEILAEANTASEQLVDAIRLLTDADLNHTQWFAHMPFALPTWQVIARNSYIHYQAHTPDLQAWIARAVPHT